MAASACVRLRAEEAGDAHFFQFGDGPLEDVPEHIDADFAPFLEVVRTYFTEDVGPTVFEVEIVDVGVSAEKTTVVSGGKIQAGVPAVDGVEGVDEIVPARIGRAGERRDVFSRCFRSVFQASSPRSSQKAMKITRSRSFCATRMGGVLFETPAVDQFTDQLLAALGVVEVQLVTHFALLVEGLLQQPGGARRFLCGPAADEAFSLENVIELLDAIGVEKIVDGEFLIRTLGGGLVVQADRLVIADDAPLGVGQVVQVIPALLNGGSPVGFVQIQIGVGPFQLDDGDRVERLAGGEPAERAVGNAGAGGQWGFFSRW